MRDSPLFDLIVVQDDGSTQRRVLSARTYTLGRSSQSDIQLDHKHISRQHARLICSAGAVTIEDLESANGIFVNGQRLPVRSPCAVSGSDSISLGKFVKLQLEAHVPSRADSAPSTHTGAVDFTGPTASGGLEIPADSLASGLRFGTRLKSYDIREAIGRGAFGRVYLAFDVNLQRPAAIKEAIRDDNTSSQDFEISRKKFAREAQLLGRFSHPNIVTVYELIHLSRLGAYYLALEYAANGSLKTLLNTTTNGLPVERSLQLAVDICAALTALHPLKIVHRDIKPSNILISASGTAKLADFGVAQLPDARQRVKHPGTPRYSSPEQQTSVELLDSRSDMYSLGLVLYEMLTGKSYKVERAPVRKLNSAIGGAIEVVVKRALEPDPNLRFQSPEHMLEALRKAAGDRPRGIFGR